MEASAAALSAERDGYAVKGLICEGQLLGIRERKLHVTHDPLIEQAITALTQHFRVNVGEHHESRAADLLGHAKRNIAGAASHIERALSGPQPRLRKQEAFPQPMNAEGHQIVHDVIAAGDGIEDGTNASGFFVAGDALIAEIDGIGRRSRSSGAGHGDLGGGNPSIVLPHATRRARQASSCRVWVVTDRWVAGALSPDRNSVSTGVNRADSVRKASCP